MRVAPRVEGRVSRSRNFQRSRHTWSRAKTPTHADLLWELIDGYHEHRDHATRRRLVYWTPWAWQRMLDEVAMRPRVGRRRARKSTQLRYELRKHRALRRLQRASSTPSLPSSNSSFQPKQPTEKRDHVINHFPAFAQLVAASFQSIAKSAQVFVAGIDGDALYAQYLTAFPEGTDPIFKKATEHSCSCCRHFIRRAGNVITVDDCGVPRTVWDEAAEKAPYPYNVVATTLRNDVRDAEIADLYRVGKNESSFGAATTRSLDEGRALTWNHLYTGEIPKALQSATPDQARGDYRTTVQVFTRGLTELAFSAVETVLALIDANNLYRGAEHRKAVEEFAAAQRDYHAKSPRDRAAFAWTHAVGPAARFRNTVIGTLVQDISEGVDVEHAVKSFETKVAPTNYKRTTAVITPKMVENAMKTIEELGLEPALERRFATISDISVRDVLWVDGSVRPAMKGGLADTLMKITTTTKSSLKDAERAEDIGLDDFVARVLPESTGLEVFLKGEHLGNLMSLTAPVNPEPRQLFRWNNDFAWSYGGNVTDSIAERVKKAGGKVEGATLRVSLSWYNYDDLDLHIHEPTGRGAHALHDRIWFGNKRGATGGTLDVDMNAGGGQTREAVENVVWMNKMPSGAYKVVVNNFAKREASDVGFVIEVECGGKLAHFSYNKAVRDKQDIHVVTLHMKEGRLESVEMGDPAITASNISQTKWGLSTEQYVKVDAVTLSPNYWGDNAVGNKHTFFVLNGAKNDEPTRGIYNEFLHPRLESHRKVFEIIGDKTKCQPTENQLSGLGFSSTKRTTILARVLQGKKQRLFNINVGS